MRSLEGMFPLIARIDEKKMSATVIKFRSRIEVILTMDERL